MLQTAVKDGGLQMTTQRLRIPGPAETMIRCPVCQGKVSIKNDKMICMDFPQLHSFPVADGIPILINEECSVFSIQDIVRQHQVPTTSRKKKRFNLYRWLPGISQSIKSPRNYKILAELLMKKGSSPKVLVVGGGQLGEGMASLAANRSVMLVETDVRIGSRTTLVCDAHNLPFASGSFDGVVIQAVLEHVVDPYRCAEEIHRVLKPDGLVYSETPFMQQVHLGRYDFTRFTHLGHRRIFRKFEEIESGATCGPGMALAWSYRYFLLSIFTERYLRHAAEIFSRLTSFYLKYFDFYLIDKKNALDAASGYYFLGRKSDKVLSDRELITLYRGAG